MKLSAWAIGRRVAVASDMQFARGGLMESVVDSLSSKATATFHSRAGPLLRYAKFWKDHGREFFPIEESMVYDYIKSQSNWAPTAPRSFLISLSFAFHIFGLARGDVSAKSGRVKGVAEKHYAERRKIAQRPPLTVAQITMLENTVHDDSRSGYDRIAAGFFLVLVYGRLRYSDGLQLVDLQLDTHRTEDGGITGFLEAQATRTKTSVTLERKVRYLPVAVPLESMVEPCWLPVWMELRQQEGLSGQQPMPLLPSPQLGGASKFGLDGLSRRLHGYHAENKDRSMLVYSRDGMADPLRKLSTMLRAIKSQQFFPDATRSGYFVADRIPEGASLQQEESDVGTEGGSSHGSISKEDQNFEEEEVVASEMVGEWSPQGDLPDRQYARHRTSRCIHMMADEAGSTLACGRTMSTRYVTLLSKPAFMHPICGGCFKH
eukprot:s792_g18.t1